MSKKESFLTVFDREHETTMRVLRAFPADRLDLRPHPRSKSARELAFLFVGECGLATMVWHDQLASGLPEGHQPPEPPETLEELLTAVAQATAEYRKLIAAASEEDLETKVHFFVGPKTMGELTRHELIWTMLHDQIHHRGQLSVYLRMADGKVPSIYGPTADEPWV